MELLLADDEVWAAHIIGLAAERGHDVRYDGVGQDRWTCVHVGCQRFVMLVGANIYGPAVREDCGADTAWGTADYYTGAGMSGSHDSDVARGDPGSDQP